MYRRKTSLGIIACDVNAPFKQPAVMTTAHNKNEFERNLQRQNQQQHQDQHASRSGNLSIFPSSTKASKATDHSTASATKTGTTSTTTSRYQHENTTKSATASLNHKQPSHHHPQTHNDLRRSVSSIKLTEEKVSLITTNNTTTTTTEDDPFGEQLAHLLNRPNIWKQSPPKLASSGTQTNNASMSFSIPPLLSVHNARVFRNRIRHNGLFGWMRRRQVETLPQPILSPRSNVLSAVIVCSSISLVIVVWICHSVAWNLGLMTWYAISYVALWLMDWKDIKNVFGSFLGPFYNNMEDLIFQRRRFRGREWQENGEFVDDPQLLRDRNNDNNKNSQSCSLWALPPPSIQKYGKRLSIDGVYLASQHPEWSCDTAAHMVGIDYCFLMLQEEYAQRQARRQRIGQHKPPQQQPGLVKEQIQVKSLTSLSSSGRIVPIVSSARSEGGLLLRAPGETLEEESDGKEDNNSNSMNHFQRFDLFAETFSDSCSGLEAVELKVEERDIPSIDDHHYSLDCGDSKSLNSFSNGQTNGGACDASISTAASSLRGSRSSVTSTDLDLPWLHVGAKIGMQLLNSAHVHRAVASAETTERWKQELFSSETKANNNAEAGVGGDASFLLHLAGAAANNPPLSKKPIHSLWTSATAAGQYVAGDFSDDDDVNLQPKISDDDDNKPSNVFVGGLNFPNRSPFSSPVSSPRPSRSVLSSPSSDLTPTVLERIPENSVSPPENLAFHSWSKKALRNMNSPPSSTPPPTVRNRIRMQHRVSRNDGNESERTVESPTPKIPSLHHPREPLATGVKVAVPIFPFQPGTKRRGSANKRNVVLPYQMGTVVSSKRIYVGEEKENNQDKKFQRRGRKALSSLQNNCLSVTVKLDKCFLRNGEFAELTFRVMDRWNDRYMPKHSKVPVGSCVATDFGLGVLVGWRVEDDCHVVRSLWQRRGLGSGHAYLNRNAIHVVMEAAVGFPVNTKYGFGEVLAYVHGGRRFDKGRFFVTIQQEGRHMGHVMDLHRSDILSCHAAQFIPVIEHIREAAHFQIQVDNYETALRERNLSLIDNNNSGSPNGENGEEDDRLAKDNHLLWQTWSAWAEIVWSSFLKAVDEDEGFDNGLNEFLQSIIAFLERLDHADGNRASSSTGKEEKKEESFMDASRSVLLEPSGKFGEIELVDSQDEETEAEPGLWIMNDIFGGVFKKKKVSSSKHKTDVEPAPILQMKAKRDLYYDRMCSVVKTLMRTTSIARSASVDHPHLRLALAIFYDFLLFLKNFVRVQQRNVSVHSMTIWNRAIDEAISTFGPIKERLARITQGIAQRMEKQGRRAKARVLKFADTLLGDERLLLALEQGDWDKCALRVELAFVKAKIVEKENLVYYRKAVTFALRHWKLVMSSNATGAATRNNEKVAFLAKLVQWVAAPRRSILKLFERNDVLDLFERILVRVFHKEALASRMLVIHASNFHTLRHLRLLKDFSTSGRLWMPVLDAANEEFSCLIAQLPDGTKDLMLPISKLFSQCVAHFNKINKGDLTVDWMSFLFEDEAVQIIHEIDTKLILALESFSRDVKDMMLVLPYYSRIDDDLLGLMDEVDIDEFLREASDAIEDEEKLNEFIREKATIAIERFINYLPSMSIPVEKRELMEGWVLTCRGGDGGDLTLSDVKVKRENLVCQILGGDALFFPMFGDLSCESSKENKGVYFSSPLSSPARSNVTGGEIVEESILDHIREMLLQAQKEGCWNIGEGGILQPPSNRYVSSVLQDLPVSAMLNCGFELWRNLEIDDDELLEIAIRDVSYQIQLRDQQSKTDNSKAGSSASDPSDGPITVGAPTASEPCPGTNDISTWSFDSNRKRFNPRVDPTVFYLEMRNLTLNLDKFKFRIEKSEKHRTILDPVFDGKGSLLIQNVSIRLSVECARERTRKTALGETYSPVLVLRELVTSLERVDLKVKDTGFGSDWLVNKAVDVFSDDITKVVAENLQDQVLEQVRKAIDSLNSYFCVNPNMLLNLLGISMEDLDDHIVA